MKLRAAASSVQGPLIVKVGSVHDKKLLDVTVPDLEEASGVCRAYIEDDGLAASEWLGGEVISEETRLCVAVVTYNGRVWMPSGVRSHGGRPSADSRVEYILDV